MRISDWSSDVCSSDLGWLGNPPGAAAGPSGQGGAVHDRASAGSGVDPHHRLSAGEAAGRRGLSRSAGGAGMMRAVRTIFGALLIAICAIDRKSTRLTPVTNAQLVCRLMLDTQKKQ